MSNGECYTKMEEITRTEPVTYCQPPPKIHTTYKTDFHTEYETVSRTIDVPTSHTEVIDVPHQVKRTIEVPRVEYKVIEVPTVELRDIWETVMR